MMSEEDSAKIQSSKPKILQAAGFAEDEDDAMARLREFAISLSSSKVSEVSQSPDLHVIQAINSLDETDKIINAMSSRLREWYGLHFPELDNIIDSINGYSQIVLAGRRDDLSKTIYEDAGFPESKVEMLTLVTDKSRGGDISDANLAIVQTLAKQILELFDLRKNLEEHVQTEMKKIAPNLSVILGPAVGARILAHAGSLKNLAVMPASTIQVLGAEKALFRSIKTGAAPPKHGLLFQHALVHAAPRWQRGKIARAVAGKAAIASRVDFHGGGLNQMLLDKLNIRVVEIEKKYVDAPPPREIQPEPSRERFRPKFNKPKGKKRKKFGRR
jgi:nucleolar protein 56